MYLMFEHSNPVGLGEERVCFDVFNGLLHAAKSLSDINLKQILDQVANIGAK